MAGAPQLGDVTNTYRGAARSSAVSNSSGDGHGEGRCSGAFEQDDLRGDAPHKKKHKRRKSKK
jgi:hypothetical protein